MLAYELDKGQLKELVARWGEPDYRSSQIWQGLYGHLYRSPSEFTNLPVRLRARLEEEIPAWSIKPVRRIESPDRRTEKRLFELSDGRMIEAVLMRYDAETFSGRRRRTLCISTQAGCAMGCAFCATGQMGFLRHLTGGEIVAQVMHFARWLKDRKEAVTNIVFMGMGEPFHNYENTMAAIDRLNDPQGFKFGARRMTISTVGLVPQIKRFADEGRQVNLAVSLHAADDKSRSEILPVNRRYGLDEVIQACRYYVERTRRRVTFEWALIEGVNDTPETAEKLGRLLKGLLCHVNAIPLNPTSRFSGSASSRRSAALFKETLERAGIPCTVRMRRGIEIQAGCGQLAGWASS
jgi:23S rRNA (adenine2503-C2)-methyltransferase